MAMFPIQVKEELPEHELLVFTGPIDAYFASQVSLTSNKKDRVRIHVVLTRVCPSLSTEAYSGRKSTWNHRHPKNICTSHICSSITIIMIIIIVVIVVIIYMD